MTAEEMWNESGLIGEYEALSFLFISICREPNSSISITAF